MSPIDLDRLRALRQKAANGAGCAEWPSAANYIGALLDAAPALFDELEAARAEIVRLGSALLLSDAYVEREAIVAWLRGETHDTWLADSIECGDHLAAKEKP